MTKEKLLRFVTTPVFQAVVICALILIFWFPILFNNGFFMDDLTFIAKIQNGTAMNLLFSPDNGHFAPMHKLLFLGLYQGFGNNIVPFMLVSLLMQCLTGVLVFFLFRLMFPGKGSLPFYLTLFFSLTTVYFEILHWFSALGQAFPFLFLLITLLLLHNSFEKNNRRWYYYALAISFLIPMNYMLGFLGIVFIALYYWLIIRPKYPTSLRESWSVVWPFAAVWLGYVAFYLLFSLGNLTGEISKNHVVGFDPLQVAAFTLYGFVGLIIRNLGFTPLIFPYTTIISVVVTIIFLILAVVLFLYFVLNRKNDRVPLFSGKTLGFGFCGLLAVYLLLAVGRQSVGIEAFINWGRYHYFAQFFLTVMVGAIVPQVQAIFSLIFNQRRFKVFLILFLALILINHFILLRQKAGETIRTEGAVPVQATPAFPA